MSTIKSGSALDAGLEYVAHGWGLCAIPAGKKGPTAKGWSTHPLNTPALVRQKVTEGGGIGLCHVASGTCALDIDDLPVARSWLEARGVDLDALLADDYAVRIDSGREGRAKLLYRLPAGIKSLPTKKVVAGETILELRCGSATGENMQDVLPPSIHPQTGKPYRWAYGNDLIGDWRCLPVLPDCLRAVWDELANGVGVHAVGAEPSADEFDALMVEPPLGLSETELWCLLRPLDPDMPYDSDDLNEGSWLKVGMALHHETGGSDLGLSIWDQWSSVGAKYEQGACERHWVSFGRSGQPITARWLKKASSVLQAGEALVLDPRDPMAMARELRQRVYDGPRGATLLRHAGLWYQHTGPCYIELPDEAVRCQVWRFLDEAQKLSKTGLVPFQPGPNAVSAAADALKAVAGATLQAPAVWLNVEGPAPAELIAMANGILHAPTRKLLPHTPRYFNVNALPFAWQPDAAEPAQWLAFLQELWGDDADAISTLQEVFGYLLTPDTSQQKMFLLLGPRRCGKGTIGRVLGALLGLANTVGPTLASLCGDRGLEPLVGKTAAIIPDARLAGGSAQTTVVERLLMISGEDTVTMDRKYKEPWSGKLAVRFVILTNEIPRFADSSGALAGRFVTLEMTRSFFGKEDLSLGGKLMAELPGILLWALDGLDRLKARGHFVQPASGAAVVQEMTDITSPVGAFVRDCCLVGSKHKTPAGTLYEGWRAWCAQQGRDKPGTAAMFGRDLRAAVSGVYLVNGGTAAKRVRMYQGIELSPDAVLDDFD